MRYGKRFAARITAMSERRVVQEKARPESERSFE
jgi:hypothetical protein